MTGIGSKPGGASPSAPLLFVDFDGVIAPKRRDTAFVANTMDNLDPRRIVQLARVLRDRPGVGVVISSSWRDVYDLATLRGFFPGDIALRVEGVTPTEQWQLDYPRHREILAYMATRFPGASGKAPAWIAIDDQADLYPEHLHGTRVLITDPYVGLDLSAAERLGQMLDALSSR